MQRIQLLGIAVCLGCASNQEPRYDGRYGHSGQGYGRFFSGGDLEGSPRSATDIDCAEKDKAAAKHLRVQLHLLSFTDYV
jgi:hypothetical protein